MAEDLQSNQPPMSPSLNSFEETLSRLSKKPGVAATLILDAQTGSILKRQTMSSAISIFSQSQLQPASNDGADALPSSNNLDEFAIMVWKFMSAAGSLIQNLDSEDEVKLLRLRTKKNELVIVPDSKFILIVVHEIV